MNKQMAKVLISVFIILVTYSKAQAENTASDIIGKAWKLRAEAATNKLAEPGLDVCDKAVELAFQHPTERFSGRQRIFELKIVIGDQTMLITYNYEGQQFNAFGIVTLPPRWMIMQKADSKTISVLIIDWNCAFDLCTYDPFVIGPCSDRSTR